MSGGTYDTSCRRRCDLGYGPRVREFSAPKGSSVALSRDHIGREYPASATYEVGREHLRQFADAIGDDSPVYRDPAAARALGYPDVIAPPTFLTVLNFRFGAEGPTADPTLGLDYSLVVHGEQSFELHRPVVAGDVLSTVTVIEDIRDAGRNELISTVQTVTAADGSAVATLRGVIVSRGTAAPKSAAPKPAANVGE